MRMHSSLQYRTLFRAIALLTMVRCSMRVMPFRKLLSLVRERTGDGRRVSETAITPEVVGWAVDRAARVLPGLSTCLAKALTASILLAGSNSKANLQIGVAHEENGEFAAHAWVEVDGHVVIGSVPGLERFKPLPSLEAI